MSQFIDEITYDPEVDAAYIRLVKTEQDELITTLTLDNRSIHLDFDNSDQLVGIEVLDASRYLPERLLERANNLK